ncbi:MerR family transcriptional regulator [Paracoccus sp. (in: a-proteobacteria)]|uniref:MerR family transcriptional regulator n=1 Tax=Paracoccus sp. TaxID=267 RepID=UPI002AFE5AD2|nr:MerR family transcriptional regulator [Paracoccus sp. (in: a-proteobacteria)]
MPKKTTFTSGEVATITGLNLETLRVWLRRDYFQFEKASGWRRFTPHQVAVIGCFAEIVTQTSNHDLARELSRWAYLHLTKSEPGSGCVVVAVRTEAGTYDLDRFSTPREAATYVVEVLEGVTYERAPAAVSIINIGEIAARLAMRVMTLVQQDRPPDP